VNEEFKDLASRIRSELPDIERLVRRVNKAWEHANRTGDDLYLDSVALNLHGFYGALERLFELIASTADHKVPEGADWHQRLLEQLTSEVPRVRPAVISRTVKDALDDFRGFRHVVRNIYTFNIDRNRLQRLVANAPGTAGSVAKELAAFADFLEHESDAQDE
jgi:hypothetical protein